MGHPTRPGGHACCPFPAFTSHSRTAVHPVPPLAGDGWKGACVPPTPEVLPKNTCTRTAEKGLAQAGPRGGRARPRGAHRRPGPRGCLLHPDLELPTSPAIAVDLALDCPPWTRHPGAACQPEHHQLERRRQGACVASPATSRRGRLCSRAGTPRRTHGRWTETTQAAGHSA